MSASCGGGGKSEPKRDDSRALVAMGRVTPHAATPAKPYPKASQLARGERRYRRKVASPKQWQAIIAEKRGPCRCAKHGGPHSCSRGIEYHHLVKRSQGGDDVAENVVPVCSRHHDEITRGTARHLALLAASLTDAEYAYVIGKMGEGGMERLFGVGRS